jgi:hypothetical protein
MVCYFEMNSTSQLGPRGGMPIYLTHDDMPSIAPFYSGEGLAGFELSDDSCVLLRVTGGDGRRSSRLHLAILIDEIW